MTKINSLLLTLSLGLMTGLAIADDGGAQPGYVYTPSSGSSVVKSAYGQCVHNAYWKPEYGLEECDEAPEKPEPAPPEPTTKVVVETITLSDADVVLFDFDKPTLTNAAKQKLMVYVDKFKESGDVSKITIDGYTDTIGNADYNKKLSVDRAQTIKNFFVANGFGSDTIVAEGMGEDGAKDSSSCEQRFGQDHLAEINALKAKLKKTKSTKTRKQLKAKIDKLQATRDKLIACAAPDRRVVLKIEHTEQVKKTVKVDASGIVVPAPDARTGSVSKETPINDTNSSAAQ